MYQMFINKKKLFEDQFGNVAKALIPKLIDQTACGNKVREKNVFLLNNF